MKNRLTPMLWLFVGCIVLCHTRLQAQHLAKPTFKNDFSIISENDGYALANRDGYYTNGIYLRFSHASKQPKEGPLIKKYGSMSWGSKCIHHIVEHTNCLKILIDLLLDICMLK